LIGGLILAAGAGTRFGPEPKLLASLDGKPLLEHAVAAMCAVSEIDQTVVVLGARADEVLAQVRLGCARPVICAEWRAGIAASLRCGVEALPDAERVIVTLGDAPTITPAVIARFVNASPGTRASYDGRPGHPVVLGRSHVDAIAGLTGDQGARDLLVRGATIECVALSSGRDVDTAEDLEAIRHEARAIV